LVRGGLNTHGLRARATSSRGKPAECFHSEVFDTSVALCLLSISVLGFEVVLSRMLPILLSQFCGSILLPRFLAREIYSLRCDVWSQKMSLFQPHNTSTAAAGSETHVRPQKCSILKLLRFCLPVVPQLTALCVITS
jgi:hypothetical protein